ncbi:hypothetical protein TrLO_g14967 [Triparma laevis f. longispina]|uniref:Phosphatase PP2A regulatory subunit A/Splicing factor 3B subunit 1-like HEAT repeat domain-containing protein n=1 Tax=Triparma laevis f. longispina TaxID=1714387 RepID=A0A9W7AUC9_9STRA|nr:hypothetical protein TrLO_g14967 [Triparma laevis f. longispina]
MSISPMQLFEEQISCDDSSLRLDAMRKLKLVGEAMGKAETLGSLIPFLADHTDDDDEMLLKMAQELGTMVPSLIPGAEAQPIVSILEVLAGVEETVVRNASITSLNLVIPHLSTSTSKSLLEMVKRLVSAEWFTGRVSSCGIFASIYSKFGEAKNEEAKDEMRKLYKVLAEDETPMVRRGAAQNFSSFASVVEKEHQATDMVVIYNQLSQDEQDSVRQLIVIGATAIGKILNDTQQCTMYVFPVVKNACNDRSWRVRHAVAKNYPTIALALQCSGDLVDQMVGCFLGLLQDTEAEVRGAAASNIAKITDIAGQDMFCSDTVPLLDGLSKDPVMEVRSKLSTALMDCTNPEECGKLSDQIILDHIQPVIQGMLQNEEESDEVKINILRKLPSLTRILGQMKDIVSVVSNLASYMLNWRIRECVARIVPSLAEAMGIEAFSSGSKSFLAIWLELLQDQVANVRSACVEGIYKIYEVACSEKDGAAWVSKNILASLQPIYDSSTFYLTRITHLMLYASLCPSDSTPKQLLDEVVTVLLAALSDGVPNVRTVAARSLTPIVAFCDDSLINTKIKPRMTEICDGVDLSIADEMNHDNDFRMQLRRLNSMLEA